ncbi:MAG: guanylate kinase [Bacteroidota bacterium]
MELVILTMSEANFPILIFSAPSGSGKTTIVRQLLADIPRLSFSVSATTRPPRGKEVNGVDYHFLQVDEFQQKIQEDAFLEWEEVYPGRFYGTLISEVDRIRAEGQQPIFDLDVYGGVNLKRKFGTEACSFFIQPPSLEVLAMRLRGRGTDDEGAIEQRLAKAKEELSLTPDFDHVIINDNLEVAVEEVKQLIGQVSFSE